MLTAIRQWVVRTMMKVKGETGIVQTMPKKDIVEINTQITAQRLMQNGIDPTTLKNANQVENAIIAIENKQKANLAENIRGGIRDTETAKVFNTAGEELDPNQPIIGGTQPGKKIDQDTFRRLAKTNPQRIKQRISDKKVETEEEILARIQKENKEAAERLRKKMDDINEIEDPEDMATGGRAGFKKGLLTVSGVNPTFDMEKKMQEIREAFYALPVRTQKRIGFKKFSEIYAQENFSSGGRAGFKMGRRAFLKLMGGVGAGIGALKSGLLKLAGKEAAPQVVKEVVEQTTKSTPPPYFFELANKIKILGTPGKPTMARQEVHNYKNYELMEDKATGDIRITIEKGDPERIGGNDGYRQEVLEYRAGTDDVVDEGLETQKGVRIPDEYEEATIYPEPDTGRLKDVEDGVDENTIKEIIEEVSEGGGNVDEVTLQKIKKGEQGLAGGGIARVGYLLGSGRRAGTALIREILKYFNRDQKIRVSEMLRTFNTRELRKLLDKLSTYRKFDVKESGMPAPQIIKDRIKKLNVGKEKVLESVLGAANAARKLDADMALRKNEMIEATVKQGFSREEAKELVEGLTTAIEKSQIQAGGPPRFKTATDEGIMDIEMMLKDLKTQGDGRKLNSSGGIAGMLGE